LDQASITRALVAAFPELPVKPEWSAKLTRRKLYSPRIDIAVGPFAVEEQLAAEYDQLVYNHRPILGRLHALFERNVRGFTFGDPVPELPDCLEHNRNARCLLAIELERSGSRKHLMGGAINAAALGRLGLSVAYSRDRLATLLRMRSYFLFLAGAGKNSFNPRNLFIVTAEQLVESLRPALEQG